VSLHWRLALWYVAWVAVGAAIVEVAIWLLYGGAYAGAVLYGVSVGIISFISMALTVSLLTVGASAFRVMLGGGVFMARYGFLALALGVPSYLSPWPVLPMVLGCAGVYLAENVLILPRMRKVKPGRSVRERVKRRVEAR
jgi:hypothetical protein